MSARSDSRPTYTVTFRAIPGIDEIRALRDSDE